MSDKEIIENIIKDIAESFIGKDSTKDWTDETIWFDAAPFACIGKENAIPVFDEAFGNLQSCDVNITNIETRIKDNSALVCSTQEWATVNKDGSENPLLIMRQSDYLEKINGEWKVIHEHTSMAEGWDGTIIR